jgi:uncharacterized protein (TIGR02246 family)
MDRQAGPAEMLEREAAHDGIALNRGAFVAAVAAGNASAAADLYADDATLIAPAADVLHGRSAIERFWQTGVETGIVDLQLEVGEVQRRGEIAFEVGAYALRLAAESGGPVVDRGRYLVVLRVEPDGQWRRAAEMFSPDA